MYERSAIVLERYFGKVFGFDEKINLKNVYKDYEELIKEIETYQQILEKEDNVINEFDETANAIRNIQQEQKRLCKSNTNLEEQRNQLFDDLDEEPTTIDRKMKKIEESVSTNGKRLAELREEFVNILLQFGDKQKERNKCSRDRRNEEKRHIEMVEKANNDINEIDQSIVKQMNKFVNSEDDENKKEIIEKMIKNGNDEKVPFNTNVIENAVDIRNKIAKKEAECYLVIYDKMRKLLLEINGDEIKLDKYQKTLRDVSTKLAFLKAQRNYIVTFLDNERMTAISGLKIHKQLMKEACESFELDMEQFNNLYDLILRETLGKSTKKAYRELYNKEYLKNIEEKEKNFEKEINSIKINTGAILNSNYWRIEEIKNIYDVFQKEITEKFNKDLSEFKLEENYEQEQEQEISNVEEKIPEIQDDIFKTNISDDDVEYVEEYEYDEFEDEEEYDEFEEDDEDEERFEEEEFEEDDDIEDEGNEEVDEDIKITQNNKNVKKDENRKGKNIFNKFFKDKKD